jgi:hypothetical protein
MYANLYLEMVGVKETYVNRAIRNYAPWPFII